MTLGRDQILGAKLKTKLVPVPAWDGEVLIRKFSAGKQLEISTKYAGEVSGQRALDMCVDVMVASIVDEAGNPLFSIDDAKVLIDKDFEALTDLMQECMAFNSMGRDVVKDAKKNSGQTTADSSPSSGVESKDVPTQTE